MRCSSKTYAFTGFRSKSHDSNIQERNLNFVMSCDFKNIIAVSAIMNCSESFLKNGNQCGRMTLRVNRNWKKVGKQFYGEVRIGQNDALLKFQLNNVLIF